MMMMVMTVKSDGDEEPVTEYLGEKNVSDVWNVLVMLNLNV